MGSCPTSVEPLVQTHHVATYMPSFRDAPFDFKEVEVFGKEKTFTHCIKKKYKKKKKTSTLSSKKQNKTKQKTSTLSSKKKKDPSISYNKQE